MISKFNALRIVYVLVFFFISVRALAQATLPDIAGSTDRGIVVLSWNCQYSGIKSITVARSADSTGNFTTIGTVKNLDKGLQAFVDGHPAAGKNYYKLTILFRSGLTWRSNRCDVSVDKSLLESSKVLLPSNDSLQHFTVTEERSAAPAKDTSTRNSRANNAQRERAGTQAAPAGSIAADETKRKIAVSFAPEVAVPDMKSNPVADTIKPAILKHKIIISFDDPDVDLSLRIKSRFINTDATTGHVHMLLPDDVNQHHYSARFYDAKGHMVIEIPRIMASKIIIDRRNFQHKGVYKFILRRDVTEFETGYITLP